MKSNFKNEGKTKMVSALNIGNNVLTRAFKEHIDITPMKLQKLIYFIYKQYYKDTHCSLFSERFEVWKYGPVVRSVYDEFREYKSNAIMNYYIDKDNTVLVGNEENQAFKNAIDTVWKKYKLYDGMVLSELTHRQGTAWREALDSRQCFLDDKYILEEPDYE